MSLCVLFDQQCFLFFYPPWSSPMDSSFCPVPFLLSNHEHWPLFWYLLHELLMLPWRNFGWLATPGKHHHCSMLQVFSVDNCCHCGLLQSQNLRHLRLSVWKWWQSHFCFSSVLQFLVAFWNLSAYFMLSDWFCLSDFWILQVWQ